MSWRVVGCEVIGTMLGSAPSGGYSLVPGVNGDGNECIVSGDGNATGTLSVMVISEFNRPAGPAYVGAGGAIGAAILNFGLRFSTGALSRGFVKSIGCIALNSFSAFDDWNCCDDRLNSSKARGVVD